MKFGSLRLPEKVDEWEKDRTPESLTTFDSELADKLVALEELTKCKLFRASARAQNFIWAMDDAGEIKIAVEELALTMPEASFPGYPRRRGYRHPSEDKKLGHPTLLNGGHARIAGELAFDEDGPILVWVLNANSGRYCRQKPPTLAQLESIADLFRSHGVKVIVDTD